MCNINSMCHGGPLPKACSVYVLLYQEAIRMSVLAWYCSYIILIPGNNNNIILALLRKYIATVPIHFKPPSLQSKKQY